MVVDDHPVVLEGVKRILENQPDFRVVATAQTGFEALTRWRRHTPDVGIIDLRLCDEDGVQVIKRIRAHDGAARLVVLSAIETDESLFRVVEAGARSYLTKRSTPECLVAILRRVALGEFILGPEQAARLAKQMSRPPLTGRETQVLGCITDGRANKEIATQLGITTGTVKAHVANLFAKLGTPSRTEAIREARRRGLVHE